MFGEKRKRNLTATATTLKTHFHQDRGYRLCFGNINSAEYISVLDTNLWPVIAKNFENKPWILQEDNCPVHRSAATTAWKEQQAIWQSQSPDINIIKNVWQLIKLRLEHRLEDIELTSS